MANSALPSKTQEGIQKLKVEIEHMGLNYIILYHKLKCCWYVYIYIYITNISLKDYHRIPTHAELIQQAVIHPTETINHPNRTATQLRTTLQLTRFDDEIC